jgi:catechol O-methyltransferase
MNIGAYKSGTVVDLIKSVRPKVMVELGGYVGYSAIAFGAALRDAGGKEFWSLERSPEFGAVIGSLVDLAGLRDVVKVEVGTSDASLRRLHSNGTLKKIDLLFLDHWKPAYVTDLKLCEELGMVGPGSMLAADNVVKPGNPPYLEYVRSSVAEKRANVAQQKGGEASDFDAQHRKAHEKSRDVPDDVSASDVRGNPNLIYESKFVEGWEPSGVPDAIEITRCVGIEKEAS